MGTPTDDPALGIVAFMTCNLAIVSNKQNDAIFKEDTINNLF
jgi:hypothetical protein